jgi:hypothetical protein
MENKESLRSQLEKFIKEANDLDNISLGYGLLDQIERRRGYQFPDLREELTRKLNLMRNIHYN